MAVSAIGHDHLATIPHGPLDSGFWGWLMSCHQLGFARGGGVSGDVSTRQAGSVTSGGGISTGLARRLRCRCGWREPAVLPDVTADAYGDA